MKKDEKKVCCICGKEFIGYGNNPWPIKNTGVCCDECNFNHVIMRRILQLVSADEKGEMNEE